jgi:hypothetical protein
MPQAKNLSCRVCLLPPYDHKAHQNTFPIKIWSNKDNNPRKHMHVARSQTLVTKAACGGITFIVPCTSSLHDRRGATHRENTAHPLSRASLRPLLTPAAPSSPPTTGSSRLSLFLPNGWRPDAAALRSSPWRTVRATLASDGLPIPTDIHRAQVEIFASEQVKFDGMIFAGQTLYPHLPDPLPSLDPTRESATLVEVREHQERAVAPEMPRPLSTRRVTWPLAQVTRARPCCRVPDSRIARFQLATATADGSMAVRHGVAGS